jgi:hypothetical protein
MTVTTENAYAELTWTGVETSFNPNFQALDVSHVIVQYEDAHNVVVTLTRDVHFSVGLGAGNAVTVLPVALPPAPGTLLISRHTPATVEVTFADLEDFPADEHQRLAEAAALRDAELRDLISTARSGRSRSRAAASTSAPIGSAARIRSTADDFTTLSYVLEITGINNLQAYVDAAAASAALALTYETGALGYQTGAQAARDLAQLWASAGHGVVVAGGEFSAKSYAADAAAQAAIATNYANLLNQVIHDFGDFQGSTTIVADWGDFH